MTVREQKLEQDKALSIQFQRSFYPRQGGYFQGGGRRGRSYGRGGTAPFSNGNHHCGSQVEAVGSSTVKTAWGEIKLGNILYVPTLKCSLLLVGSLTEQGHIIVFTDSQCIILHIPRESRSKLDSKTLRCLFVGYDEHSKAYRVFDPTDSRNRRIWTRNLWSGNSTQRMGNSDRPRDGLNNSKLDLALSWHVGKTPIFKSKVGSSGQVEELKARLVARRFEQEEGINFVETFALVVR